MAKISEKHKANLKLQEAQKLEKERQRLLNLTGGFSLPGHKPKAKVKAKPEYRNYQGFLPAKADPVHTSKTKRVVLSEDMQRREDLAQQEIKLKESLVQPIFNKGGYQYPTASEVEASKRGELRRRS